MAMLLHSPLGPRLAGPGVDVRAYIGWRQVEPLRPLPIVDVRAAAAGGLDPHRRPRTSPSRGAGVLLPPQQRDDRADATFEASVRWSASAISPSETLSCNTASTRTWARSSPTPSPWSLQVCGAGGKEHQHGPPCRVGPRSSIRMGRSCPAAGPTAARRRYSIVLCPSTARSARRSPLPGDPGDQEPAATHPRSRKGIGGSTSEIVPITAVIMPLACLRGSRERAAKESMRSFGLRQSLLLPAVSAGLVTRCSGDDSSDAGTATIVPASRRTMISASSVPGIAPATEPRRPSGSIRTRRPTRTGPVGSAMWSTIR